MRRFARPHRHPATFASPGIHYLVRWGWVICKKTYKRCYCSEVVNQKQFLLSLSFFDKCIYMAVRDERKWEDVRPLGPEAPQLTVKQGKLLALLCNLEKRELFCQIVDDFLKFSRFILFGVERLHQYRLYQLANLSRFYVTLCRFKGNFRMKIRRTYLKKVRKLVTDFVYLWTWF